MRHFIFAALAITLGVYLILANLPRRRYITLSGHADGKLWVKRVAA